MVTKITHSEDKDGVLCEDIYDLSKWLEDNKDNHLMGYAYGQLLKGQKRFHLPDGTYLYLREVV